MLDILIVEDHKEIASLLSDFLQKEGYTVSTAETGEKEMADVRLDEIVCGAFRLNTVTETLTVSGKAGGNAGTGENAGKNGKDPEGSDRTIDLTAKEYELLKLMMEHAGTTLKKDYLFNNVWGSDSESELQTLTVHIKWLREKLEKDPKKPEHIITVWGVGYRFEVGN